MKGVCMNLFEFEVSCALIQNDLMQKNSDSVLQELSNLLNQSFDEEVRIIYSDFIESLERTYVTLLKSRSNELIDSRDYRSALNHLRVLNSYNSCIPKIAFCFSRLGMPELASSLMQDFDREDPYAWEVLADIFYAAEDYQNAIFSMNASLNLESTHDRLYKLATYSIANGDFDSGWALYESRFLKQNNPAPYPDLDKPLWTGFKTKSLLVHWEQGFGDSIMFCRFLPLLRSYSENIYVADRSPLHRLLASNFDFIKVVDPKDVSNLNYECHIPFMSLAKELGLSLEDIEGSSYLDAIPQILDTKAFKVGISWQGAPAGLPERNMDLLDLAPVLNLSNVQIYSFQKGLGLSSALPLFQDLNVIDLGSTFEDFYDTACALKSMDLFITTDNCLANLAGAMGVRTFLLLSKVPEFRWMNSRDKTVWYDSIQIFRQEKFNDWSDCVFRIKNLILQLAGN